MIGCTAKIEFDGETGQILRIELWHPINGKWRHLMQDLSGEKTVFFTDGWQELRPILEQEETANERA